MAPSAPPGVIDETGFCKYHPRTPARYRCPRCSRFFCELCVNVQGERRTCRACGADCASVRAPVSAPGQKTAGFFSRLPGSLAFPFKGSGVLVMFIGTFGYAVLSLFRGPYVFSLTLQIFATGYLFAYLQNVIYATAAGDEEGPQFPDATNFVDDIFFPCFRLVGLVLFCFGPAYFLAAWGVYHDSLVFKRWSVAALGLGCFYFPMAFLAAAILDSILAVSPVLVVPSIFKVFKEYLVTMVLLGFLVVVETSSRRLLSKNAPSIFSHSMSDVFVLFGEWLLSSFVALYFLTVNVRILGLLYLTKKQRLGWLPR